MASIVLNDYSGSHHKETVLVPQADRKFVLDLMSGLISMDEFVESDLNSYGGQLIQELVTSIVRDHPLHLPDHYARLSFKFATLTLFSPGAVSYTHLTLPTNREV